jgi:flagellar protein FlaG
MDIQSIGNITTPTPVQTDGNAAPPVPKTAAPVQTAEAVRQAATVPSMEQLSEAVKNINKALETHSQDVEFALDSDTEKVVIKVVDRGTGKVLRQMPSEEALQIAKALDAAMDKVHGVLIQQKA